MGNGKAEPPKSVVYNSRKYTRNVDSPNWADRVYYRRGGGKGYLHRDIYLDNHGAIPDGWHVHHADHDPFNNDPANLVAISPDGHAEYHSSQPDRIARLMEVHHLGIEAAKEWHRSEDGLAWHREHAKRTWEGRTAELYDCDHCGAEYSTRDRGNHRFCSNACKSAWRRKSGLDDVDRTCAGCGGTFRINKYSKARSCSRKCAQAVRHGRASGRLQPDGG